MIRQSVIRNNPISEYNYENRRVNSSKFSNDIIVYICKLFENGYTNKDFKKIAELIGLDISSKNKLETFRMYCTNLYKRKHHTHISKNYNW